MLTPAKPESEYESESGQLRRVQLTPAKPGYHDNTLRLMSLSQNTVKKINEKKHKRAMS